MVLPSEPALKQTKGLLTQKSGRIQKQGSVTNIL